MAVQNQERTFDERLERIETLLETIQQAPNPALRNSAEELVETLLELHGNGLERVLELIWDAGDTGKEIIHEHLVEDELASSLLLLHGLHPLGLAARVEKALDEVRPYMDSHGGGVELMSISDGGVVRVKLHGTCESCAASAMTLKYAVEDAVYAAAPDVAAIETVEEDPQQLARAQGALPDEAMPHAPGDGEWHEVKGLAALAQGAAHAERIGGRSILFCRLNGSSGGSSDGALYAYENECPSCHQSLGTAEVEGQALTCSHCGQSYDVVEAGRGQDTPSLSLSPFPLLPAEEDYAKVALPKQQHEVFP